MVDAIDWERVCRIYGDRWAVRAYKGGWSYITGTGPHDGTFLSRVLAGAKPGEGVVFLDGNTFNLARGNLATMTRREATLRAQGKWMEAATQARLEKAAAPPP